MFESPCQDLSYDTLHLVMFHVNSEILAIKIWSHMSESKATQDALSGKRSTQDATKVKQPVNVFSRIWRTNLEKNTPNHLHLTKL